MESRKTLTKAKAEFVEVVLREVSQLPREAAAQKLSGIISDLWNYCETQVKQMPVKPRKEF